MEYPKRRMSISEMVALGGYSRDTLMSLCHSKSGERFARNPTGGKWIIDTDAFDRWEKAQDLKRRK